MARGITKVKRTSCCFLIRLHQSVLREEFDARSDWGDCSSTTTTRRPKVAQAVQPAGFYWSGLLCLALAALKLMGEAQWVVVASGAAILGSLGPQHLVVVRQKCVRRHSITLPCVRNGGAGHRGAESGRPFRHSRRAEHADIACRVLNESSIRGSK